MILPKPSLRKLSGGRQERAPNLCVWGGRCWREGARSARRPVPALRAAGAAEAPKVSVFWAGESSFGSLCAPTTSSSAGSETDRATFSSRPELDHVGAAPT